MVQNPEQESQEQKSSVGPKILKVTGAIVAGGVLIGGGNYVVNKGLKRVKSSKLGPKDVNNEYVYLDSAGNGVTKTEEGKKIIMILMVKAPTIQVQISF